MGLRAVEKMLDDFLNSMSLDHETREQVRTDALASGFAHHTNPLLTLARAEGFIQTLGLTSAESEM